MTQRATTSLSLHYHVGGPRPVVDEDKLDAACGHSRGCEEAARTLTLAPRRNVSVSTGWGFYWRESEQDGLYGIPGNLIVPSNGVPGHYEGSRPIAEVAWTLNPHLSVHLDYIFVFNGQFEEQSVHATKTESYISPRITYRF